MRGRGERVSQLELDKSQLQLAKLKELRQKFCLSEVQFPLPPHTHTHIRPQATVTLFAIHFIYLELDRDRVPEREREGACMHSTPTGNEFESFVKRARTHMLMHTLPQSNQGDSSSSVQSSPVRK